MFCTTTYKKILSIYYNLSWFIPSIQQQFTTVFHRNSMKIPTTVVLSTVLLQKTETNNTTALSLQASVLQLTKEPILNSSIQSQWWEKRKYQKITNNGRRTQNQLIGYVVYLNEKVVVGHILLPKSS